MQCILPDTLGNYLYNGSEGYTPECEPVTGTNELPRSRFAPCPCPRKILLPVRVS